MSGLSLADLVEDNAVRHSDVPAYLSDDASITHALLRERAGCLASALSARGVRRQDRIGVLGRNSVSFGEVLAAGAMGAFVVATVNFRLAPTAITTSLAATDPRVIFADPEFVPGLAAARPSLPDVALVVVMGPPTQGADLSLDELVREGAPDVRLRPASGDDLACLISTSGTTGAPKHCMVGHREMRELALVMNAEMRTGRNDRALLVMPQFHIGAMAIGLGLHARGGTAVLESAFEPTHYLDTVAARRVSVLHLAPTMLAAVLEAAATRPGALADVRTVVYSAAPITPATLDRALATMPSAGFLNLYGQTEVITSGLPRELHRTGGGERGRRRLAAVGHPFPGTRVRIVDDRGEEVPTDTAGEIEVNCPSVFRGYWNDHQATLAAMHDGWFRTGDVGRVDDEGLLHLVDRVKDMIITGGENVASVVVESALSTHSAVAACAVVGVPDDRWGETVCAVVVPTPGAAVELVALQEHARQQLARYMVPRRLMLVDALPTLPSGKVDKKALRIYAADPQGPPDQD
jgi:acyl-CoA synthetase (AMP-forming)/AMP-acid ligase II